MLVCFKHATKDGLTDATDAKSRVHPGNDYVRAWQDKTLGFSFSGGGMMMPYIIGVAKVWTALCIITPDCALAGASAGALLCASICCGFSPEEILDNFLAVAEDCRQHGVEGRLINVLKGQLHKKLPEDAHLRCNGRLHVALSRFKFGFLKTKKVSHFYCREDLIEALCASSHIPRLAAPSCTVKYRGHPTMDGGVTNILPTPPGAEQVIKVLCLPTLALKEMPVLHKRRVLASFNLSPDKYIVWPYSAQVTMDIGIQVGSKEILMGLLRLGETDALTWAHEQGFMAAIPPSRLPPQLPEPHHLAAAASPVGRAAQVAPTNLLPVQPYEQGQHADHIDVVADGRQGHAQQPHPMVIPAPGAKAVLQPA